MPNLPPEVWAAILAIVLTYYAAVETIAGVQWVAHKTKTAVVHILHPHRKA